MTSACLGWEEYDQALASHHYPAAAGRALRQLIEALLFERVLDARIGADAAPQRIEIAARDADGARVLYHCTGRASMAFGRIRLGLEPILRSAEGGAPTPAALDAFVLEALAHLATQEALVLRFLRELQQTVVKDTLARSARAAAPTTQPERDLSALEGQLQDGHPYHPCYKSRIGFDALDNAAYGPEFAPSVRLCWLALRRTQATVAACRDIDADAFVRAELGEALDARFTARLRGLGLDPHDYLFLPAHPWQWREQLAGTLAPLLQRRELVWLGEGEQDYRPLQSIRSLANASRPKGAHVKLPLSIVNTSADRILSCHSVRNAPLVSDWLCGLLRADPILRDTGLVFLREVVGIHWRDPAQSLALQAQQYGILGVVWRESVDAHLRTGEAAAPFSGLCQCEADGRPFIAPWVARHDLLPWLDALLEATLPALMHLLFAHGIGMEAHAQNIVLLHRDGWPVRIALKDLPGGLRFVRRYLADASACPEFAPTPAFRKQVNATAGMESASPAEVRDYFHDAVFFINLGQLSLFLHEHYDLAEGEFWSRVARCIGAYQARYPQLGERFAAFDLFASTVHIEQLARRRLFAETEARLQEAPNPLHGLHAGQGAA